MTFRKLPARYLGIVLPLIISIFMSCLVSGIATYKGVGFPPDFLSLWVHAWGFSWIIAFPILMTIMPFARRLAFVFVEKPENR